MTVSLQHTHLWSAVSEIPSQMQEDARQPVVQQITRKNILRVLIAGFGLVTLLLLAAGFIGVTHIRSIQESATSLFEEQLVTTPCGERFGAPPRHFRPRRGVSSRLLTEPRCPRASFSAVTSRSLPSSR